MKNKETFTKYDKHLLAKEWKKRKPLAYITKDRLHLIIFAHQDLSVIGMKFKGDKAKPFISKLQPKQFFIVEKTYFPLHELRYYDEETEQIAFPSALNPLPVRQKEDYMKEDPLTKIFKAQTEGTPVILTPDDMQQLTFQKKDTNKPTVNYVAEEWSASSKDPFEETGVKPVW